MTWAGRLTLACVLLLGIGLFPVDAYAQETTPSETSQLIPGRSWIPVAAAIGAGAVIAGAAFGIGRIGSAAVESMARQPEAAGNIQTAMLVAAALIEGVTFFALIVLLISLFRV